MLEKRFCPYCGASVDDGCRCEIELSEYKEELLEELEERSLRTAWQQDLIDMYRYER